MMYLLYQTHELPDLQQAQGFWTSQQTQWDCWLAALRMALRFWGFDFDYRQLLSPLVGTPLRISEEYGVFFPYVALIASHLGFWGWLRCPLKNLPELADAGSMSEGDQLIRLERAVLTDVISQCRETNSPRSYLYESLLLLLDTPFRHTCRVYTVPIHPSFQDDIACFLKLGVPVVAHVHCDEFYQLPNDDSGHLLTFVPVSDIDRGFVILDGYRERGYAFFSKWEQHLAAADSYDWAKWSNWLLAIVPRNALPKEVMLKTCL